MFEILFIAFMFWVGYQLGIHVTAWRLRDILREAALKEGINVDRDFNVTESKLNVSKLVVERQNNMLYLYDYKDDTFVCQATTVDELAILAQKYKNIEYASVLDGEEVVAFINGKVKTIV